MPVAEPAHLFAAFLASLLGSGRVVVVTYGPDGGYHHPDHVRAHDVARRALTVLNDGSSEADRPSKTFTAPEFWQVVGPDTPLPAQAEILAVPVLPVLTKIVLALQQYATQVQEVAVAPNLTCSQEQEQIDGIDSGDKAVAWFELSNAVPQPIGGWEKYLVSR
jgi:N-acetyl-1-D-myo-inositol-2-amino-2-deoxy-alpha-D-glucopyranoside deacetylase